MGSILKIATVLTVLSLFTTLVPGSAMTGQSNVLAAPTDSFSTPVMVNDVKATDQGAATIVGLPGHGLFVAWQDPRAGNEDIYTSTSQDNGG